MITTLRIPAFCAVAASVLSEPAVSGAEEGLTKEAAAAKVEAVWKVRRAVLEKERAAELEGKAITIGDKTLKFEAREFGKAPEGGRSLWISMHGGGGAPPAVNDQQWRNQIGLYEPAEGWYVAPRAPTDTWNLWHEGHISGLFDRLIDDFVVLKGVNPEKVYLMGYSAGGDGVWQLAPRMPDRLAAAAMMAGHPNDASLLALRNLPLGIFVGGADGAYNRNKVVAAKGEEIVKLRKEDSEGYESMVRVYPGLPHWMNRKDAEALPWMAEKTRRTWPDKLVWLQTGTPRERFYWLSVPAAEAKPGRRIDAVVKGRVIALTGDVPAGLTLRLSDQLLTLDEPVTVTVNGKEVFSGKVSRTAAAIEQSLAERADPAAAATALLTIKP